MNTIDAPFIDRLLPAPVDGGFSMEDYWVWCGSVIRGEDGRYHMFASRWPKAYPMFAGYPISSEVVRAVSDTPEGPYKFEEVVLADRGEDYWDGRITHNPMICRCGDTFLLFYIGSTFSGPRPGPEQFTAARSFVEGPPVCAATWRRMRSGLATSKSVRGPWVRRDEPILLPRPGRWDHYNTVNPTACVHPDGRVLLIYRSSSEEAGLQLGVAFADHFSGDFFRLDDEPIRFEKTSVRTVVEDPFVWHNGERYEMLAKDCDGQITGEERAGVHATSDDGIHWSVSSPSKAYSRRILWEDGRETVQGSFERPFLLFEGDQPTHLFAATTDSPGGFIQATRTWNMVVPLRNANKDGERMRRACSDY